MKLFKFQKVKRVLLIVLTIMLLSSPSLIAVSHHSSQQTINMINQIPSETTKKTSIHPQLTQMINQVNTSKIYNYIKKLQDFGPHPTGSEALHLAAQYLFGVFQNLSYDVYYHNWTYKDRADKNIIATLPGTNPTENIIILCAHYDTVAISPGAEDDSSGVASVLMIAEILQQYQFNNTIEFILFSGEEQGKYGSTIYAQDSVQQGKQILAVLALDKISYATNLEDGHKIKHHTNDESAWMVQISKNIAQLYPQEIDFDVILNPPDPGSDHKSFTDIGIDGSDFVRFEVNPFYHTSEDTLEYVNMTYLTKACKLALGTVVTLADINPHLTENDLQITMKGTQLSSPAQFAVGVTNSAFPNDTADLTISVTLKHLFRDQYVQAIKPDYNIPCNWTLVKEINESWEFQVGGRKFTRGFFKLTVILNGYNDDIHVYKTQHTYGVILNQFKVWMIPK